MNVANKPRRRFSTESWTLYLEDEGIRSSLLAGVAFGALQILAASAANAAPLEPIKAAASLLLRDRAYQPSYWVFSLVLGVAVHFSLALLYGYAFGLMSTEIRLRTRLSFVREALLGILFGLIVWGINFAVIAHGLYPWLYATNLTAQALLHALGFGLPLSLLFARNERRRVARVGPP